MSVALLYQHTNQLQIPFPAGFGPLIDQEKRKKEREREGEKECSEWTSRMIRPIKLGLSNG